MSKNSSCHMDKNDQKERTFSDRTIRSKIIGFAKYNSSACAGCVGMGLTGLEPVTLRLSSACSNQLSYRPVAGGARNLKFEISNFKLPGFAGVWRQGDSNP